MMAPQRYGGSSAGSVVPLTTAMYNDSASGAALQRAMVLTVYVQQKCRQINDIQLIRQSHVAAGVYLKYTELKCIASSLLFVCAPLQQRQHVAEGSTTSKPGAVKQTKATWVSAKRLWYVNVSNEGARASAETSAPPSRLPTTIPRPRRPSTIALFESHETSQTLASNGGRRRDERNGTATLARCAIEQPVYRTK
eukprot:CAMPEP_0183464952 /NCGR_PEP_ID=MMETSP0370-20130417/146408_1 /TAXON_ID=268820 /ORGANISM="Peridinium aciculiferum, Strain PAER-2" /LENGTH=194 /DNA_ID=CAMNT_0025657133 /DNA_START=51 /DNA_END=632 /DNA_ORIENTATION=-